MKKIVLLLALGIAITFANAQTGKSTTAPTNKNATTTTTQNKTSMKVADLQKAITDDILKSYPGYKTLEAFKLENKGVETFEVVIEKSTDKSKLFYDTDGKFLRKAAMSKTGTKVIPATTTKSTSTDKSDKGTPNK
jgi:hypothetical protein